MRSTTKLPLGYCMGCSDSLRCKPHSHLQIPSLSSDLAVRVGELSDNIILSEVRRAFHHGLFINTERLVRGGFQAAADILSQR